MTISDATKRRTHSRAAERLALLKRETVTKLVALENAATPPLDNAELGRGLELADEDRAAARALGRLRSEAPRNAGAVPARATRALIELALEGEVLVAIQALAMPGARREVLFCEASEATRLGADWTLTNLAGGPVPERASAASDDIDWEDEALWSGGAVAAAPARKPEARQGAKRNAGPRHDLAEGLVERRWQPRRGDDGRVEPRPLLGARTVGTLGLGAMRLSTAPERPSEQDAIALLHAAWDAGLTFVDTANVYAADETELGHSERLIARARDCWAGDPKTLVIGTKVGMARPGGRWVPDGHPEHLKRACEQSLVALGVERLDLLQLHLCDPRIPWADSIGALAELKQAGKVAHLGLCNVNVAQLEEARRLVDIVCVQNVCNPFDKTAFTQGMVAHCLREKLTFLAHSPVGGHRGVNRALNHRALSDVAWRHAVTNTEVVLAWLLSLGPHVIPLPGATRLDRIESLQRALSLKLSDGDLAWLDEAFPFVRETLEGAMEAPSQKSSQEREVVLTVGIQGAGKSTWVGPLVERGYARLNRDSMGGTLASLVPKFDALVASGATRIVLDNTYATVQSRRDILAAARAHGLPVRCVWLDASVEDALVNVCQRMLENYGRLLSPDELKLASRKDPSVFPPAVLYRFARLFEPPELAEGFAVIERKPFQRRAGAASNKALLLDFDGTLRRTKSGAPYPSSADDLEILPGRSEVLKRWRDEGALLLGVSNQSGVAAGRLDVPTVQALFERTCALLDVEIDVAFCPHEAGAPQCYCRKPMPGLGVAFIERYALDRSQTLMVGDLESDAEFARILGVRYVPAAEFFG